MYYSTKPEGTDFLSILSTADQFSSVGGTNTTVLRVFMKGDVVLMDSRRTDYDGRICLVKTPQDGKKYYMRLFYDGDTVLMCDPTDGELVDQCKVDELECFGVVTGIVRKLEAEPHISREEQDEARAKVDAARKDPLQKFYRGKAFEYMTAIKAMQRGSGYGCFCDGWFLGFVDGCKAERRYIKRQQKVRENNGEHIAAQG